MLGDQQRLGIEDAIEVGDAPFELGDDQLDRFLGFADAGFEPGGLLLGLDEADQRVFDLAARPEHGLLILQGILLEPGILHADVVGDAAVVEHVPLDRRQDDGQEAFGTEQIRQVVGGVAQESVDRQPRIQIGLGHADLRALGGDVALGTAHVGTPPEQVGRHAHGHFDRRTGDAAGRQLVGQVGDRVSQQNAQLVGGLAAAGDQRRNERFGLGQIGAGLGDVQFGGGAAVEALFGQPQRIRVWMTTFRSANRNRSS